MFGFLYDIFRTSFPKDLRFCKRCLFLHAQLSVASRKHKDKRFIPMNELREIVDKWQPVPYRIMQIPILRVFVGAPFINTMRVYRGGPSWLLTKNVEIEYNKFVKWLDSQVPRKGLSANLIDKEKFDKEVLGNFKVAQTWHRLFIFGMMVTVGLVVFVLMISEAELCLAMYFKLKRFSRADVKKWLTYRLECYARDVEVLDAYKDIVGEFVKVDGSRIYFRGLELSNANNSQRIVILPTPWSGSKEFFDMIGDICLTCDALLMEQTSLDDLKGVPPATYFPLKNATFPSLGLHHRYWSIIRLGVPPPQLLPSRPRMSNSQTMVFNCIPVFARSVLFPQIYCTKLNAKTAWGYLKRYVSASFVNKEEQVVPKYPSIAIPWSVWQAPNLASSLIKMDYVIRREYTYLWIDTNEVT
eukprot:PhF_6_TR5192/c0_g1_i1/m.7470